jgi:transcriptional regulator with XRE-family HTH domain
MRKPLSKKRLKQIRQMLAASLRWRREQLGWTQGTLSESAGLHRTYVSLIERTLCDPTVGTLYRLAWALEIDVPELLRKRKAPPLQRRGRPRRRKNR